MYKNFKDQRDSGMSQFSVVFVLGGPGVGKGTQCARIVETFGFQHLSAGDLLRAERAKAESSEIGKLISDCMTEGKIVPVSITCRLLRQEMERQEKELGHTKFLVDGFPRNVENRQGWETEMASSSKLLFVLVFDAPDDVCVARCMGRGRGDDHEDTIRKRVEQFHTGCQDVISQFEKEGVVRKIAAEKGAEEVWMDVKALFEKEAK